MKGADQDLIEVGLKIMQYEAREKAIQDMLTVLQGDENLEWQQAMVIVRRLARKQFNAQTKAKRLRAAATKFVG